MAGPRGCALVVALLGVVAVAPACSSGSSSSKSSDNGLVVVAAEDFWGSIASQLGGEFVVEIRGEVKARPEGTRNAHIATGDIEVDVQELRIMGSKSELLRTLVAASSAKTAGFGVPSSVPKWRARHDSNV